MNLFNWPFKRPALTVEQRMERGDRMRRLLESGEFTAASEEVVRGLFKRWTEAGTPVEREAIHAEFRAWAAMSRQIVIWQDDATLERSKIDKANKATP